MDQHNPMIPKSSSSSSSDINKKRKYSDDEVADVDDEINTSNTDLEQDIITNDHDNDVSNGMEKINNDVDIPSNQSSRPMVPVVAQLNNINDSESNGNSNNNRRYEKQR